MRELVATGGFALVAAERDGALMVGPRVGARWRLEPLDRVASDDALVAYSATLPLGGQQVVGVARADVDRVDVVRTDGTSQQLPLNQWRGFSYDAAETNAAAATVVAYSSGTAVGALQLPRTTTQAAAPSGQTRVYGISRPTSFTGDVALSRIDPRTLQPVGRRLSLPADLIGFSALSPDGNELALASPKSSRVLIVSLGSLRVARTLPLEGAGKIRGISWPQPDRLVELRQVLKGPYARNVGSRSVVALDPRSGKRIGSNVLTNKLGIHGSVSTPYGLVLLLGSSRWRGPNVELVLAGPDGTAKTIRLDVGAQRGVTHTTQLAVDSAAGHAYVAAWPGTVFDIDLQAMSATRHVVRPAGSAGSSTVPTAIGSLQLGVLAHDLVVAGLFRSSSTPIPQGISIIDTGTWAARLVDARASEFTVSGSRLITYGLTTLPPSSNVWPPSRVVGRGLELFDAAGNRLAHLYGSRRFQNLLVTPGFGHVLYNGKTSGAVPQPGKQYPRGEIFYAGPNDQLVFDIDNGAARGSGSLSKRKPPTGPPLPIFRGSDMVGESGDRLASQAVPFVASPSRQPVAVPLQPATATPASTIAQRYTVSNRGREVTPKQSRPLFEGHPYKLFLLGTKAGTAFYRVQLTPHFTCWGNGSASHIGSVGSLGCPNLVGAYPLQSEATVVRMNRGGKHFEYLQLAGIAVDQATSMALVANGQQIATTPITNNLYAFPRPYPTEPVRVVALDANGAELKAHPEWGQHQTPPLNLFGPRATRIQPSQLGHLVQHASADGVNVSVDGKGTVLFEGTGSRTFRPPAGRRVGFDCFQITSHNVRKTRSAGISYEWRTPVAFKILGYIKPPFDGCEIQGSYGHRWHDQYGPHSAVEVPLTAAGRRYFEDRAAARDLALFVRSRKTQQIRKLTGSALIAAIRHQYGAAVSTLHSDAEHGRPSTVGVWTSGARTVFSETSTVGVRFFVELQDGKIKQENVRGLAFVF